MGNIDKYITEGWFKYFKEVLGKTKDMKGEEFIEYFVNEIESGKNPRQVIFSLICITGMCKIGGLEDG